MSPHPGDGTLPLFVSHRNVAPGVWLPRFRRKERGMDVHPDEFVSAREASRSLGKLIDRLERGEVEKLVIVDRNKPRAILTAFPARAALNTEEPADG